MRRVFYDDLRWEENLCLSVESGSCEESIVVVCGSAKCVLCLNKRSVTEEILCFVCLFFVCL